MSFGGRPRRHRLVWALVLMVGLSLLLSCALAPAPTPAPTATPNPLAPYAIDSLRARSYPGGKLEIVRVLDEKPQFTRYLVAYPSDGLRILGMMNLPKGQGPFPVVILNHSWYDPATFSTGLGTMAAADDLAAHGYLTLSPDYRNHRGSDQGDNAFSVGYVIDALNAIAAALTMPQAKGDAVGMWGHSMGGGITIKALEVSPAIKVAAVYNSIVGDEASSFTRRSETQAARDLAQRFGDPETNPQGYAAMSARNYLHYIAAPVIIHHGENDPIISAARSGELARALEATGKTVEFYTYPGEGHFIGGRAWVTSMERTLALFDRYLKGK